MESEIAFQSIALALGFGLLLTVVAHRYDLPTIVLLLGGGLLLGPAGLGWIDPYSLGDLLPVIVSLSIGVILFEGGLTLKPSDYFASPKIIKRLLSIGALATWMAAAFAVWLVFDASWQVSLLSGSLVIVTGPTVILPLLHRLRLPARLASILHWEGVLIDAIGVFIAVFCYELVTLQGGGAAAAGGLVLRFAVGLGLGVLGGISIQRCLERNWIPDSLTNPFALAAAVLVFAAAERIAHESGLLAVTVAGVIVGSRRSSAVRQILTFKAELTNLLIGTLFLLLVSRLDPRAFLEDGWRLAAAVAIVILVGRPLNIALSSVGSGLSAREKLFLAWVAPRGIVAASIASLFALQLSQFPEYAEEASLIEGFVYSTICATVVLQGLSAGWWARRLGLSQAKPDGWLIVGAHEFGRALARALREKGIDAVLVDNNQRHVEAAESEGLAAALDDARDVERLRDSEPFQNVSRLLALTDNAELNELVASRWRPFLGREHLYAWAPRSTQSPDALAQPIYSELPEPSHVSDEIAKSLSRLEIRPSSARRGSVLLGLFRGGQFHPLARPEKSEEVDLLYLLRKRTSLDRALERGGVFTLKNPKAIDETFVRLCDEALLREPRLDRDLLLHDLKKANQRLSPIFGSNVAAHHLYSQQIERSLCLLALLDPPIDSSPRGQRIAFVILIISPSNAPEEPLSLLSQVVQICHEPEELASWASTLPLAEPLR